MLKTIERETISGRGLSIKLSRKEALDLISILARQLTSKYVYACNAYQKRADSGPIKFIDIGLIEEVSTNDARESSDAIEASTTEMGL